MTTLSSQCIILVGGLGTRLGSITRDVPKPLLQVGEHPFLYYLIIKGIKSGFNDFILLAGYKGERVREFADLIADKLKIRIQVLVEAEPLGTAGALLQAEGMLNDEFLLMNGDSFFDINLLDLTTYKIAEPWVARLAIYTSQNKSRYGSIVLKNGVIKSFSEKSSQDNSALINGGIYWLKKAILDYIDKTPCSMEKEVFPVLAKEALLYGRIYDAKFIDIGVPEDLEYARSYWNNFIR